MKSETKEKIMVISLTTLMILVVVYTFAVIIFDSELGREQAEMKCNKLGYGEPGNQFIEAVKWEEVYVSGYIWLFNKKIEITKLECRQPPDIPETNWTWVKE